MKTVISVFLILAIKVLYCAVYIIDNIPDANLTDVPYATQWTALEKKILTKYVRTVRPVKNDSVQTVVSILPFLQHIENVNEEEQTIRVHGYFYVQWNDEYLTWDINEFSGLNMITIQPWYVWTPQLMLYNSASGDKLGETLTQGYEKVRINYEGQVTQFPTFSVDASCFFDFSDYPYDTQECPLIIGSWSYPLKEMDFKLLLESFVYTALSFNETKTVVGGWRLTKVWTEIHYWDAFNKQRDTERPPPSQYSVSFPELYIWIRLQRWAPYFGTVVLFPAISTSFFTLAAFWTKKPVTGIIILMINLMIQAVFAEDLLSKLPPSNGSVPRIVRYIAINSILTTLAIPVVVILMMLKERYTDQPVPPAMRSAVYLKRQVSKQLDKRSSFQKQVDQEDVDEKNEENRDDSKEEEDGQKEDNKNENVVHWDDAINLFKTIAFVLFLIVYLLSMFILLTY